MTSNTCKRDLSKERDKSNFKFIFTKLCLWYMIKKNDLPLLYTHTHTKKNINSNKINIKMMKYTFTLFFFKNKICEIQMHILFLLLFFFNAFNNAKYLKKT